MRYLFDEYALDIDQRELLRAADAVSVAPQVFDLLAYLIRNRECVVSRDELITAIWGGRAISDSALTTRVNVTRRAVGDDGARQRLIRTVARKGFRFVGAVREERSIDERIVEASASLFACPRALADRPSIAVLPFVSMSGEPHGESLAQGLGEDMLTELAKLRWLTVAAHAASFVHRRADDDIRHVGSALGVRYVLEGSVREIEGRVRITSRLVDALAGIHLWAERYDRDVTGIASADDAIVENVVAAAAIAIAQAERRRAMRKLPDTLDAWETYQRGMWHMSQGDAAENELAQGFFQRAIDLDLNFAPAHGALAWSYMMAASIFSRMSIHEGCALAEPLARKAVGLDENDLEARARLAIAALLQGDLEGAYEGAERVLAAQGTCAEALGVKGAVLVYSGRGREGCAAIRQHLALSPLDPARPIRLSQIAMSLYLDGNYPAAATAARHVVQQYPKHPIAFRWLAASLGQLGRSAEAEEVIEHLRMIAPSSFDMYVRQRPRYCSIEHAPMMAGLRKAGWKD